MKSKNVNEIADYAKSLGLSPKSKVINITHYDLDGAVSAINLKNYVLKPENLCTLLKTYTNVNEFFTNIFLKDNCIFKNPDFIIMTDLSVEESVVEKMKDNKTKLIILDHHETALPLNKFENCFVDDTGKESGCSVTLKFLKCLGYNGTHLDKLNEIATQFDLFLFKGNDELRRFELYGKKRSLAELFNSLFFQTRDAFLDRWETGYGSGLTKSEVERLKQEYKAAQKHVDQIDDSKMKVDLSDDKVLLLSNDFILQTSEYYLEELNKQLLIMVNVEKKKFFIRCNDNSKINVGKILSVLAKKCEYVDNGGGHKNAGGGSLVDMEFFDDFIEKILKLCKYYE